jgi:phage repressor protein C with HTH and peptisase S24 domain
VGSGKESAISVVQGGKNKQTTPELEDHVELPIVKQGVRVVAPASLERAQIQEMITISRHLVPVPDATVCVRVESDSMRPILEPGYIAAIEFSAIDKERDMDRMVAARGPGERIAFFWLRTVGGELTLIPHNMNSGETAIMLRRDKRWKSLGRVLWWIGMPK